MQVDWKSPKALRIENVEPKRAEQALRESEDKLRQITETVPGEDSDKVARLHRSQFARDSEMISPGSPISNRPGGRGLPAH